MKKKLLIVLTSFDMGGAQNMVYELLRCIDRNKFEVSVLCYGTRANNTLTEKLEEIQYVKYLNIVGKITPVALFKVLREITKNKPDVVHAHLGGTVFAVIWGLLHRKPIVVTAHTKPEKAFSKSILPFLKRGIKKNIVRLVAVSKENQLMLMQYFGLDTDKCAAVNNGINIDRYYRKAHETFTFINVGRQDENKNQAAIIRCFAKLYREKHPIKLYLVGDGDRHKMLIEEADKLGVKNCVVFTGNVGNTEDFYALSDCYVQASHREALPLTALEAMATGLPIISTDVGGMKDIVSDGNGYLVNDNDEDALYKAMKKILTASSEEQSAFGKASLKIVENYSAKRMAQCYEKMYCGQV